MDVLFIAGFAPISTDVDAGHRFYRDTLGLPPIARLLGPEGLLVGICHTPHLHD